MTYVEGFVVNAPADNRQAYLDMARFSAPIFHDHGASRVVECWQDDVPDGKLTDFRRAVKAEDGDAVLFSWIEWPDKAARDAGMAKFMDDPRMKENTDPMPFDGQRTIFGGFAAVVDEGRIAGPGYVDGYVVPVPDAARYRELAAKIAPWFVEHGATRVVECRGDDLPAGKITDFRGAVKAEDGEEVFFSWVEWPSKEARDEGNRKVMADPRMTHDEQEPPFDGKRIIFGGFAPILDSRE